MRILGWLVALAAVSFPTFVRAELPKTVAGEFVVSCKGVRRQSGALDLSPLGSNLYVESRGKHMVVRRVGQQALSARTDVTRSMMNACLTFQLRKENNNCDCSPNYIYSIQRTPNDSFFSSLYGLQTIGAPAAWERSIGSRSVKVAVIDTGVLYTHPDLSANVPANSGDISGNGIDDDNNGFIDDVYGWNFVSNNASPLDDQGHGSHCAGTIGGVGDNGTGVTGVNWEVGLVAVKVLDSNGSGSLSDVASGINYAVDRGVDVISMSLGGPSGTSLLEDAMQRASDAGIFIATAAGNESADNDTTGSFPANYGMATQVSVAATDSSDALADFSNYGDQKVHLGAPGVDIRSTVLGDLYDYYSGTSMATPHVAGAAALLKAINSSLTGSQIKDLILNNLDQLPALQGKTITGGRLNLNAAAAAAAGATPVPSTPTPSPTVEPTPDPDATPDPDPTAEPEPADTLVLDLSKGSVRRGKVRLSVDAYYQISEDAAPEERVLFVCRNKVKAVRTTNSEGSARATISIPRGRSTCYAAIVEDGSDPIISNTVRVRR